MEWLGLSFCAQGEYPLESVKACKGFVVLLRGLIYARLWICTKVVEASAMRTTKFYKFSRKDKAILYFLFPCGIPQAYPPV
ncbi:hypothetical protein [Helicobacter sp. UBA3407]|uniref:Uncharacterized protein n=1 Tax=Helicobacter ganmani TaxID=60246 RepID=A0A3D8IBR9_9HELI|nr:hypothetical protein [Helicobacter sp. UBA3407]RDU62386.1 hypothetical protein CQA43_07305 [Helicobacter ganmani]